MAVLLSRTSALRGKHLYLPPKPCHHHPSLLGRGLHFLTPSLRLSASSSSHIPTQTHWRNIQSVCTCMPPLQRGKSQKSTRRWAGVLCATSWTEFLTGSAHTCSAHGSCAGGWVMGVSCDVWVGVMCGSARCGTEVVVEEATPEWGQGGWVGRLTEECTCGCKGVHCSGGTYRGRWMCVCVCVCVCVCAGGGGGECQHMLATKLATKPTAITDTNTVCLKYGNGADSLPLPMRFRTCTVRRVICTSE
jgi:hypothetical protein